MKRTLFLIFTALLLWGAVSIGWASDEADEPTVPVPELRDLNPEEDLGRLLFFDESLSTPPGQACSACHAPEVAFADPEKGLPVSRGAVHGRFGNRNDQPVTYALFVPPLHFEDDEGIWEGGLFWDGRVNTLEEQAMGPPFNPLEMANSDTLALADNLRALPYADRFEDVYGAGALDDHHVAFKNMARAIAAFERTALFAPFDSKFDLYLKGEVEFTEQERRGLTLFEAVWPAVPHTVAKLQGDDADCGSP